MHGDGKADRRLAIGAEHRRWRIDIAAPHGSDVGQPQHAAVDHEIDVGDVALRAERAGDLQSQLLVAGLDGAGGLHHVLAAQSGDQRCAVDAEAGELLHGEFDEDALVLRAENLDLGNVGNIQQFGAHAFDIVAQFALREAVGSEAVDQAEGVAEFIVEARSDDALRQAAPHVANAFAHVVPDVRHLRGRRGAFQIHEDRGDAGPRVGA